MWTADKNFPARGFSTPPATWKSKRTPPTMPGSDQKPSRRRSPQDKADLFHVIHKVPAGDSPYVRAKHVQLIDKDPSRAISLFWTAINAGDRVDSALKDMAVVMKQLNRADEAIEAIKSFRHLCPFESQESLDNVLVELYKRSGRIEEQIEMLQVKLKFIEEGMGFGGKRTKIARSQGKKIQITVEQEYSRLLGNLAWAYMQQGNYKQAEEHYRKALTFELDKNKQCNLAICLMHMNRMAEAKFMLQSIQASSGSGQMDESYAKSFERAIQTLEELESQSVIEPLEENQAHLSKLPSANSWCENYSSGSGNEQTGRIYLENDCKHSDFEKGNGSQPSPQKIPFANKFKKGSYTESLYGRRFDFGGRRNWNGANMGIMDSGSVYKGACTSPFFAGYNPKVPFTQPRRNSGFSNENARSGCSRKLSFDQPTRSDYMQFSVNQNFNECSPAFTSEMCGKTFQRSESHFPSINGDWRKRPLRDFAEVNNATISQPSANGEWKVNFQEKEQMKLASEEYNMLVASAGAVNSAGATETFEPFLEEDLKTSQEPPQQSQSQSVLEDCKKHNSSRSWADIVEEDEKELLNDGTTGLWSFDGSNSGEEFNDENLNSNVIVETPGQMRQINIFSQKFNSFNLKDGYYTQPQSSVSSVNIAVRRSLCFDQHQKPETEEKYCPSPLSNKILNFEGQNPELANGNKFTSGNGNNLLRRNRLQVFQDITHLSESPRS